MCVYNARGEKYITLNYCKKCDIYFDDAAFSLNVVFMTFYVGWIMYYASLFRANLSSARKSEFVFSNPPVGFYLTFP